jgi:hypothetical protein
VLTSQQVRQFQQADDDLDSLTIQRVLELLALLDFARPDELSEAVLDELPSMVDELADVSALISATMYETAREQAGARGTYVVNLSDPPPRVQVHESTKWALSPLYTNPDLAAKLVPDRLTASTPRLVRLGGRKTVVENTDSDPARPRYRRVLSSAAGHCDFCKMLAGRGAVYRSEDSAGAGRHFHDNCKCRVELQF